jgi:hypothetical protein
LLDVKFADHEPAEWLVFPHASFKSNGELDLVAVWKWEEFLQLVRSPDGGSVLVIVTIHGESLSVAGDFAIDESFDLIFVSRSVVGIELHLKEELIVLYKKTVFGPGSDSETEPLPLFGVHVNGLGYGAFWCGRIQKDALSGDLVSIASVSVGHGTGQAEMGRELGRAFGNREV